MDITLIYAFIEASEGPVTKREISNALNIKGTEDRALLKKGLRRLERDGKIERVPGGAWTVSGGLPDVLPIDIVELDLDGDLFARPVEWDEAEQGPPPRIEVDPDGTGHPALAVGDRTLAKITRNEDGIYTATIMRKIEAARDRIIGELKKRKIGFVLQPASRKMKDDYIIDQKDAIGARPGDMVAADVLPSRGGSKRKAKVVEILGDANDPKLISVLAMQQVGIRPEFPEEVIDSAKDFKVPDLGKRQDLRSIPLVTIDGEDARDFDDAVFAEKTEDGWHLIVAIADVSYYVRPGSPLDIEARKRGNSTYFPDRVVPMLPEILSNDLCSLRPHENRACMAFHLWIDESGKLVKHKIVRGIMRSAARLVYEQVQAAMDGQPDDTTGPLLESVIKPLYAAWQVLDKARNKRGALDLDLPEKKIVVDFETGKMTGVTNRVRMDSHRLIEEFMILANVAAAQALEARKSPCVYRIHDTPSPEKIGALSEFVDSFGLSMPKGNVPKPENFNRLLTKAKDMPYSHLVTEMVLRSQAQAVYAAENIGHFGLALQRYAHFTSPIRRYADLVVHRSLVKAYGLGEGGLSDREVVTIDETCDHISQTERASAEAERNAVDRFAAAYLSSQIGAHFAGRINGVTRFGLFVSLTESGADGLVPIRSLPNDYYIHDEKQHTLIGRRNGLVFRMGAPVEVKILEADPLTGSTVFEILNPERGAEIPGIVTKTPKPSSRRQDRGKGKFSGKGKGKKGPKKPAKKGSRKK